MKKVLTIVALFVGVLSFAQTEPLNGKVTVSNNDMKLENLHIEVMVDSAEEVASTFTTKTIKELIEETKDGEEFSLRITCNSPKKVNGVQSKVSYKVKGNSDDKSNFLKSVQIIRAAAINYYESKQ